jgi:hypothetical protein
MAERGGLKPQLLTKGYFKREIAAISFTTASFQIARVKRREASRSPKKPKKWRKTVARSSPNTKFKKTCFLQPIHRAVVSFRFLCAEVREVECCLPNCLDGNYWGRFVQSAMLSAAPRRRACARRDSARAPGR